LSKKKNKVIYRNPDKIQNAKQELKNLIPAYQPISGSQKIAYCMDINGNKSDSFNCFSTFTPMTHLPLKTSSAWACPARFGFWKIFLHPSGFERCG
jgi:hypothetical protein